MEFLLDGVWRHYYDSDDRRLQSKGIYENGIKQGKWKYYQLNLQMYE